MTHSFKETGPYSAADVQSLFEAYADEDEADTISAENFERLCTDANVPMEGPMPLILLWHLDAKDLGTIKRGQWTKAMHDSQCVVHTLRLPLFPTVPQDFVTGHTSDLPGRHGGVTSYGQTPNPGYFDQGQQETPTL